MLQSDIGCNILSYCHIDCGDGFTADLAKLDTEHLVGRIVDEVGAQAWQIVAGDGVMVFHGLFLLRWIAVSSLPSRGLCLVTVTKGTEVLGNLLSLLSLSPQADA